MEMYLTTTDSVIRARGVVNLNSLIFKSNLVIVYVAWSLIEDQYTVETVMVLFQYCMHGSFW